MDGDGVCTLWQNRLLSCDQRRSTALVSPAASYWALECGAGNNSSSGSGCGSVDGATVSFGSFAFPGASANGRRFFSQFFHDAFPPFLFRQLQAQMYTADGADRPPASYLHLKIRYALTFPLAANARCARPPAVRLRGTLASPSAQVLFSGTPVCLPSIRACLCCGARLCKSYAFCRRPVARPFLWTFYLPDIYTANSCLLFTFQGTARQNAKPVLANRVVYALVILYLHFGQNTATHKVHFVRLCTL